MLGVSIDGTQREKLVKEYTALATTYDHRRATYLDASLRMTIEVVDRVPAMLDVARQRIGRKATLLECEAAELPFGDASFQLAICTNALHYFPDTVAALQEMRRVITTSGHLVVTDWCRDYLWMRILNRVLPWTIHAHAHTFSTGEIEQCLALAGLKVVGKTTKKVDWFWGLMTIHAIPI